MIRAAELALFFAPLAAYILWRVTVARGQAGPSPQVLAIISVGLLLFGGGLAWLSVHERMPEGARYIPAALQNGRVVPGHAG